MGFLGRKPATPSASQGDAGGGEAVHQPDPGAPLRRRRPELRRRLALVVLVVGVAGLVAYWSRGRPVEVEVIYDFGRQAPRVVRVELSYAREGRSPQPVEVDFPSDTGAPKRWRHTLRLVPGVYQVRARVHLAQGEGREAEVMRHSRRITVKTGEDQRLVLRLAR